MKHLTTPTYREVMEELRASLSRYQYELDCGEGGAHTAERITRLEALIVQVKSEAGE